MAGRSFVGLQPGFHGPEHEAAFVAARTAWLARGGPRRCGSLAKHGGPCRGWALRGSPYCAHHAPNAVRRERRLRLLRRPETPEQAARVLRRECARAQRVIWKRDRWAGGATVDLGAREMAFEAQLQGTGFNLAWLSPASADAARWAWLQVEAGRMTPDQFCVRVRWHAALDGQGA